MAKFNELKTHHQTIFALIIALAVISFWRGVWGLLDKYLFPTNLLASLWASLALGLVILVATNYTMRELM